MNWDWQLDGWTVVVGVLCAVAAALLGNFLVLRRLSMLGDAISHAVLPGLAAAFLITHSRATIPMFLGAVVAGIVTAMFTEWIRRFGDVEESASMGVVFTSLFALGLLIIVRAADHIDLDAGCVLYGAIERTPLVTVPIAGFDVPRAAVTLAVVLVINAAFVTLAFKELKISAFDASLSAAQGISPTVMHYGLMILVAVTAVAAFESVGNILVVAMFIVPPATAMLLTRRLGRMIGLSTLVAAVGAACGHVGAIGVPAMFGLPSTTTAGMMAVSVGMLFCAAVAFSPSRGLVPTWFRNRRLSRGILRDDIIATLYRRGERGDDRITPAELNAALYAPPAAARRALRGLSRRGWIETIGGNLQLTAAGRDRGRLLVRAHRLWETYLVERAELSVGKIHHHAELMEHFTDPVMREQLAAEILGSVDPHGREIPPADRDEVRSR